MTVLWTLSLVGQRYELPIDLVGFYINAFICVTCSSSILERSCSIHALQVAAPKAFHSFQGRRSIRRLKTSLAIWLTHLAKVKANCSNKPPESDCQVNWTFEYTNFSKYSCVIHVFVLWVGADMKETASNAISEPCLIMWMAGS